MALPADFSKIFGSTATGGLTPIGDVNYAKGWEFVGSNPPTKNDFSYLQNLSDLKSQWLYSNKLQRADPFGDIKADGSTAVSAALENLGLGDGSALPVGVPVPWPLATPPTGWLKCNGSPFNLTSYPALAAVFPTGVLPDLRGEFIRGWDDGRGVDSGRGLLTAQEETKITNHHGNGAYADDISAGVSGSPPKNFVRNADSVVNAGSSFAAFGSLNLTMNGVASYFGVRPRNIAFNYIVRAA